MMTFQQDRIQGTAAIMAKLTVRPRDSLPLLGDVQASCSCSEPFLWAHFSPAILIFFSPNPQQPCSVSFSRGDFGNLFRDINFLRHFGSNVPIVLLCLFLPGADRCSQVTWLCTAVGNPPDTFVFVHIG
jgi:hypothetical protein